MDNFKVIKGKKRRYVAFQIDDICFVTFKKDLGKYPWNFQFFKDYFKEFAGEFYVVDLSQMSLRKFINRCVRAQLL